MRALKQHMLHTPPATFNGCARTNTAIDIMSTIGIWTYAIAKQMILPQGR